MLLRFSVAVILLLTGCVQPCASQSSSVLIHAEENKVESRFSTPQGYKRIQADGFATYLRSLQLQPHGKAVHLYNGTLKRRQDVHAAVIKMDVGTKDLQQCADAVMRLRAEYLYHFRQYDEIHFNFTNGFRADYSKWRQGYRIVVKGNDVSWVKRENENSSYASFRQYMDVVFSYAGTLSLSKELKVVPFKDMLPGDVLIQGGSPGHAVIVVDVAVNKQGNKVFLVAQSYMPAQEIHILVNPANRQLSPWYSIADIKHDINTPEWEFTTAELKRFE